MLQEVANYYRRLAIVSGGCQLLQKFSCCCLLLQKVANCFSGLLIITSGCQLMQENTICCKSILIWQLLLIGITVNGFFCGMLSILGNVLELLWEFFCCSVFLKVFIGCLLLQLVVHTLEWLWKGVKWLWVILNGCVWLWVVVSDNKRDWSTRFQTLVFAHVQIYTTWARFNP